MNHPIDPKYLSDCHNSPVYVVGSSEGTNHYECLRCKKSCGFHAKESTLEEAI